MCEIKIFQRDMQQGVIDLILNIQNKEFDILITKEDQPDLLNIEEFYQSRNGNFWCALDDDKVIGTIALIHLNNKQLALRKMFVLQNYRGSGIAKKLLDTSFQWAKEKGYTDVYLGTTEKFIAAHRFYEKNGFSHISIDELPRNFPIMKVDTKFYSKKV